jgi:hypothetical protein
VVLGNGRGVATLLIMGMWCFSREKIGELILCLKVGSA